MCFHSPRSFSVSSPLYLSIVPPPDRGGCGTDDHNQFHLFRLFIFTVLVTFDIRPVPFLALHLLRPETDNKFWKKRWLTVLTVSNCNIYDWRPILSDLTIGNETRIDVFFFTFPINSSLLLCDLKASFSHNKTVDSLKRPKTYLHKTRQTRLGRWLTDTHLLQPLSVVIIMALQRRLEQLSELLSYKTSPTFFFLIPFAAPLIFKILEYPKGQTIQFLPRWNELNLNKHPIYIL